MKLINLKKWPNKVVLGFFLVLLSCACERKQEDININLPPTPLLTQQVQWGVIINAYTRIKQSPDDNADTVKGLPAGAIVQILFVSTIAETSDGVAVPWYRISFDGIKGWVWGANMKVEDSWEAAQNLADGLK